MWDSPFYRLQNRKLYLNTLTKQALREEFSRITLHNLNRYTRFLKMWLGMTRCCPEIWSLHSESISNKFSKPKIWRVNPQKITPTVSLNHCLWAKKFLLMNSGFFGRMTYCSLAKQFMRIKNSTNQLKYSVFT